MKKIYIIHENSEWVIPLKVALTELGTPFEEWFITDFKLDVSSVPPEGVFYNRMSASSHTRGNRFAPEMTAAVLAWLESHNRTILNGRNALKLELSKLEQYSALGIQNIPYPKTLAASSSNALIENSEKMEPPFILKPNRGGKGSGVQLFFDHASLKRKVLNNEIGKSIDGIWLIQEFIAPKGGKINRVEIINGKYFYTVEIDATNGFELCPADGCQVEDAFCPVGESATNKFEILENLVQPEIAKYLAFLKSNDIHVGAIEYSESSDGTKVVYDVNTNTNYNAAAESRTANKLNAMQFLAQELSNALKDI
ncbi:MAG: ATP-grasp domain-containing protein [Flavobacteriales bacterium]